MRFGIGKEGRWIFPINGKDMERERDDGFFRNFTDGGEPEEKERYLLQRDRDLVGIASASSGSGLIVKAEELSSSDSEDGCSNSDCLTRFGRSPVNSRNFSIS